MKNLVYRGYNVADNDNQLTSKTLSSLFYRGQKTDQKDSRKAAERKDDARLIYRGAAA